MRAPIRPLTGSWPAVAQRLLARFFWPNPTVVLDETADPAAFRTAMNAFYLGGTIKITGTNRHPAADELLLRLDLSTAVIVDLGASDGSTSLDLITRLPSFRSFVISDRYLHVRAVQVGTRTVFTDPSGHPILIVGPRPSHGRASPRPSPGSTTEPCSGPNARPTATARTSCC